MTTENFCFYLQNRLIQTSQTGGQQYSDTSPFSIPCFVSCQVLQARCEQTLIMKHCEVLLSGKLTALLENETSQQEQYKGKRTSLFCRSVDHLHRQMLCNNAGNSNSHYLLALPTLGVAT
jgi:hypothetical protein